MALTTKRPVTIHARGAVTTIEAGKPLPAGTPDRVIKILQAQDALDDIPSTPAAAPVVVAPVAQDATVAEDGKSTATPAKR
ncbi:TPA: hypothetical protein QDC22_007510 [Burkholderia stabilis]|nr:hypothetical protein [Burkholderia stabilis]HDR9589121.1 hypothetical protein [Burkholderia stabilis]HDR9649517.1 hypothetical protein [Burkholderia stabilis]HDR9653583.1 hypothetical protein [Burkholderia stabilis]HDR9656278.1 hypothetical protein [Burkholderia stabilis]